MHICFSNCLNCSLRTNAKNYRLHAQLHRSKRVMYWYQTKFDDESHTGDKAVIESISKKPIKVIFENNAVKKAMLKGDSRFSKPWNELAYLVDVRVQTVRDEPKVYTIINYLGGRSLVTNL